jgi:hypothetical protein
MGTRVYLGRVALRLRLATVATCLSLLGGAAAAEVASAHVLGRKQARKAAFGLARQVAQSEGAAVWWAGKCRRKGPHHVVCWGAIVFRNYDGAAQRISVRSRGHSGNLTVRRSGQVYTGNLRQEARGQSGGGEWAVCGIRSSVCIGS